MQAFFSSDGSFVVQFLVIFLVILVLLIGAVLLFRRFSGRGRSLTAGANGRGRQPRLGIVDIYELDRQRQLILLRRDNVEHLLLVGGPNDVVIERNIQRGAGARYAPEPDQTADPAHDGARTERFLDSPAPPAFAMPEIVPPAMPGAEPPHPERTPPLDPGLFEPEVVAPAAAPARSRPASPVSRLIRRTAPPLADTPPEPAPVPAPAPPPASEPVPETPPVIAGRGPRPVDPAVLSDMARQLQVALKRPSSAVTPPPGGPESPPLPPAPDLRPDPLAAAMAAAQAEPAPAPKAPAPAKPVPAKPAVDAKPAPEAKVEAAAKSIPALTALADPAPVTVVPPPPPPPPPAPPQPAPAPAKPAEAAPKPAPKPAPEAKPAPPPAPPKPAKPETAKPEAPAAETTTQNPFSVEEIEAEFARLLGRPLDNNKG
ncbi:hypothetical protein ASG52_11535 [Methylobacterium sp. Leaf456]|uniref:FliO/MopB family protein n=1 Tax=Methylobacterium sp. Leaf456 TaxID=1736382 RepID=UPI0006FAE901|nr:FliO/MopB family protein [Methylobacterium sp. Leaf456]KQT47885.1 hypothetical protein ASG52_11535 [Methylobacterium sp. Leaf456]